MSGSLNKVLLIGNLGRDPEVSKTPSGASVASFSIASTEKFTDKSGNKQEQTEWHNIVLWNRLAQIAGQYLKKGSSVYIEGKLRTRMWEDGNIKKYRTEIIGSSMQLLDKASGSSSSNIGSHFDEPPAWMTGENDQEAF